MAVQIRLVFLGIALACFGLIGGAVFFQYFFSQIPCTLCILQRILYAFVGAVALLVYFQFEKVGRLRLLTALMFVGTVLGWAVAARQVWLQEFPPVQTFTKCIVSFGSFIDGVLVSLGGVGSCLNPGMLILGLSLAHWSLFCFSALLLINGWLGYQAWQKETSEDALDE